MQQTNNSVWTSELRDLWDRIGRHDFEPDRPLNFTKRLARDKKWTLDFARSAILEYRRFCFLAAVAPHPVTPSEEVDEIWHMHLTYSRDYWDVWCRQVLGRTLHHDPTSGETAEHARFRELYAETLALYEAYFGPPDAPFWPATHRRFGYMPRYRGFDSERWFLIPRPIRLWRRWAKLKERLY